MNVPDWIKSIVELKPRFLFALWLLGALVLFLPRSITDSLGFTPSIDPYRGWVGLATLAAFIFWLVQLQPWEYVSSILNQHRLQGEIVEYLATLSPQERFLLAYCLHRNQQSINIQLSDPVAATLRQKGLLRQSLGVGDISKWPHMVPKPVWKEMQAHREMLLSASERKDANLFKMFEQFERYLQGDIYSYWDI